MVISASLSRVVVLAALLAACYIAFDMMQTPQPLIIGGRASEFADDFISVTGDEKMVEDVPVEEKTTEKPPSRRPSSLCMASFFIIGARKGGTTSLYEYISSHPGVYGVKLAAGPQAGELFYVERHSVNTDNVDAVKKWRDGYDKVVMKRMVEKAVPFDSAKHLTGESSVGTSTGCASAKKLLAACGPNIKILYLARDPVEQMISRFRMRVRLQTAGYSSRTPINPVLRKQLNKAQKLTRGLDADWYKNTDKCVFSGYKNGAWNSLHVVHLERFLNAFGEENMLVRKSEDFFREPAAVVREAYNFLGLDAGAVDVDKIVAKVYNEGTTKQKHSEIQTLDEDLRKDLRAFFAPYNRALSSTWGIDINEWEK